MTQPGIPAQPAMGAIRLTIQGSVLTSNMITPKVRINGYQVPSRYGLQDIPVYAGPTHLDVDARWLRTYGQASLDVAVAPDQVVEVFYAAPVHQFTTGSIGFTRQRRKGVGTLLGLVALALVVLVGLAVLGGS